MAQAHQSSERTKWDWAAALAVIVTSSLACLALPSALVLSMAAVWLLADARDRRAPLVAAGLASGAALLLGLPAPLGLDVVPAETVAVSLAGAWLSAAWIMSRTWPRGRAVSKADASQRSDVHDAKQGLLLAADMFQTVLDAIPARVFWKDRRNDYVGCNASFAQDAGVASPAEIAGKTDFDLSFSDQAELYRADDQQVMNTGEPKLDYQEPQLRPDGTLAWLRTSKIPLFDPAGEVIGVLGTYEDITDRKHLEEQLRQAQKLEAVGQLAGGIAHDFNNVLTVILGNTEALRSSLLSSGKLDDAEAEELADIGKAADRAAAVTRGLLAFSRREVIEPRVVSPDAVLLGVEAMLRTTLGESVDLQLELADDVPHVLIDMRQLEQAMLNLVINARDAMPDGGTLTVSTRRAEISERPPIDDGGLAPGLYAEIRVRDTGVGMTDDTVDRIFEPFYTTKGVGEGTGLGLSTVHGIVTGAGGQVHVESRPSEGSCFTICLPAALGEADVVEAEKRTFAIGGRETVLVVEDDVAIRRLTCHVLESRGYRVLEGRSPQHAIALAETYAEPIQLIVTDVIMPGLNGREVSKAVCDHHPETRVLYMSGYTADIIAQRGAPLDGASFLEKPFTSDQLLRRVRKLLDAPVPD